MATNALHPGRKTIPSLDGIRTVAVMIVFVAHAGLGHVVPGGFGVTVFFFLSGYLITTLFFREQQRYGSVSLPAFYMRRLLRLSPPLFITLAVAYTLMLTGVIRGSFDPGSLVAQALYAYNYYGVHIGRPYDIPEGSFVLWSLAVEEHFYLVYPLVFLGLCALKQRIAQVALLGVTMLGVLAWRAWLYYGVQIDTQHLYYATDARLDSILYGCVLAFLVQWRKETNETHGKNQPLFSTSTPAVIGWTVASLMVIAATLAVRDEGFRYTLRYSLQGVALIPLFFYAVQLPNLPHHRVLNTKLFARVGAYSYSLYLIHLIVIKGLQQHTVFQGSLALTFVVALAISLAYSAVLYRVVEQPVARLRHRFTGHDQREALRAAAEAPRPGAQPDLPKTDERAA